MQDTPAGLTSCFIRAATHGAINAYYSAKNAWLTSHDNLHNLEVCLLLDNALQNAVKPPWLS